MQAERCYGHNLSPKACKGHCSTNRHAWMYSGQAFTVPPLNVYVCKCCGERRSGATEDEAAYGNGAAAGLMAVERPTLKDGSSYRYSLICLTNSLMDQNWQFCSQEDG